MTYFFRHLAAAGVMAVALEWSAAAALPATADAFTTPPVPANIEVPEGNTLFLTAQAQGTQNYICLPSATGFSWTFFSPQATLFLTVPWFRGEVRQQVITHFLSPNPSEGGTPRPTWQSSLDTSAVWARVRPNGSSTDPGFVAAGAIPWLVLEAVGTARGPAGGNFLAQTAFIQRLKTSGGVVPSSGCASPANVGATALVPYTAEYLFYKAATRH